jgi:hydrogenase maturation protein HypF
VAIAELTARRLVRVTGTVQGVGFRPHVFRLATEHGLRGAVWNEPGRVVIDVEGEPEALDAFLLRLTREPPPAARFEAIDAESAAPAGYRAFEIRPSSGTEAASPRVPPDLATCAACLREIEDPGDRRAGYPFLNCTDCGPRFTIVREVPYDRARTTMAGFGMCADCAAEYHDPASRRFHAQPTACPACGPHLWAGAPGGAWLAGGSDAVELAARALAEGRVVALKGLGGFHLACAAGDERAVARLRERKRRPDKPFAVMFPDLPSVEDEVVLEGEARDLLLGQRRPIVLLRRRPGARGQVAASVAPRLQELGVMLPYTPLHHLLLRRVAAPLVMTSGNVSEEPIAASNEEALSRLSPLADLLLLHDREIHTRCDDSVVRPLLGRTRVLRRARGDVPEAILLPDPDLDIPDLWAVGADLKNAPALVVGGAIVLGPHIGDLETLEARLFHAEVHEKLVRMLRARPAAVAHDLHPAYHGTSLARASGLPAVAVQHHHAHIASCLVDNERSDRVIGVAWDGTGFGPDGTVWGGELLVADLAGYERVGHLRPVPLPGGDQAARQGWRMAIAHLRAAGLDTGRVARPERRAIEAMIAAGVHTPLTSSAGRLFDAVASLVGLRHENSYEGQAAMELEAASGLDGDAYSLPVVRRDAAWELDAGPLVREIVADLGCGVETAAIGGRFHAALALAIERACAAVRDETGLQTVALSGGCFQNALLTRLAARHLTASGFEVLLHARVPPSDGGIAVGQAAVAASRLAGGR